MIDFKRVRELLKQQMNQKVEKLADGRMRVKVLVIERIKRYNPITGDMDIRYDERLETVEVTGNVSAYKKMVKFRGFIPSEKLILRLFGKNIYYAGVSGQGAKDPTIIVNPSPIFKNIIGKVANTAKRIVRYKLLIRRRIANITDLMPEIDTVRFVSGGMFDDYRTDGCIFVSKKWRRFTGSEVKGAIKGTIMPAKFVPDNEIWVPIENALKIDIRKNGENHGPIDDYKKFMWIAEIGKNRITTKRGVQPLIALYGEYDIPEIDMKMSDTSVAAHVFKWFRTREALENVKDELRSAIRRAFRLGIKKAGAVALPDIESDTPNWITIPKEIARHLHVKTGDTVVIFRSPLASIGGLTKVRVTVGEDPVIYVHPDLWKFVGLGDFDGDMAFVTNDNRIVELAFWTDETIEKFRPLVEAHDEYVEKLTEEVAGKINTEYEYWRLSYENAEAVGYLTLKWYSEILKNKKVDLDTYAEQFRLFLDTVQIAIEGMKHGISIKDSPLAAEWYEKAKRTEPDEMLLFASGKIRKFDKLMDAIEKFTTNKLATNNIEIFTKILGILEVDHADDKKIIRKFGKIMNKVMKEQILPYLASKDIANAVIRMTTEVRFDRDGVFNSFNKIRDVLKQIEAEPEKSLEFAKQFGFARANETPESAVDRFRRVLGLAALTAVQFPWNIGLADMVLTERDKGYIEKAIRKAMRIAKDELAEDEYEFLRAAFNAGVIHPDTFKVHLVDDRSLEYEDVMDELLQD